MTRSSPDFSSPELLRILTLVSPVAERLRPKGHRLYLVGGVVRDLMLAKPNLTSAESSMLFHDIDLTTDARPDVIRRALEPSSSAMWTQGERFGTVGAQVDGRDLEVTTHRAEVYDPESRKPVVTFGDDLHTDLSRRDFTINAMAIDVVDEVLHDPYGGETDLAEGVLRTPLDPEIAFTDDPLRMLRAARFIPRFNLSVDEPLRVAVGQLRERLEIVSSERVHDELERLLAVSHPGAGLEFLSSTGLLTVVIPGLTGKALEASELASRPSTVLARRAGLLWPLGPDGANQWLQGRRYPTHDRRNTVQLITHAAVFLALLEKESVPGSIDDRVVPLLRRSARSLGANHLGDMLELLRSIASGSGFDGSTVEWVDGLNAELEQLRESEDLSDISPPLEGGVIMDALGIPAGPDVGLAVSFLVELQLQQGPLTAVEATTAVTTWWAERSDGS